MHPFLGILLLPFLLNFKKGIIVEKVLTNLWIKDAKYIQDADVSCIFGIKYYYE